MQRFANAVAIADVEFDRRGVDAEPRRHRLRGGSIRIKHGHYSPLRGGAIDHGFANAGAAADDGDEHCQSSHRVRVEP